MTFAQGEYADYYDTGKLDERGMDMLLLQERMQEDAFQYQRDEIEGPTILQRFANWLGEKLFGHLEASDVRLIYRILLWIIGIIGVLILVFYLRRLQVSQLLFSKDKTPNRVEFLDYQGTEEDLDSAWKKAEDEENYALAMRLLFIKSLHFLKENKRIQWSKEKTNGDYLKELQEKWEYTPLARLAQLFAFSQYGGYPVNQAEYFDAKTYHTQLIAGEEGGDNEG